MHREGAHDFFGRRAGTRRNDFTNAFWDVGVSPLHYSNAGAHEIGNEIGAIDCVLVVGLVVDKFTHALDALEPVDDGLFLDDHLFAGLDKSTRDELWRLHDEL